MVYLWKSYKQSRQATLMSALGAVAIGVGIMFAPLTVLIIKDLGFHSYTWAMLGMQAAFILVGVLLMAFAPKQARREMDKRIVKDVEYARYLVHAHPELKEYVRELQPAYYEDSARPIIDYAKRDDPKLPLWRKVLFALLLLGILAASTFLSSK